MIVHDVLLAGWFGVMVVVTLVAVYCEGSEYE